MKEVREPLRWACPNVATVYHSGSSSAKERYVVALVVGYDHTDDDSAARDPKEAAELALQLVKEGGTVWTVLDRETGIVRVFEDLDE